MDPEYILRIPILAGKSVGKHTLIINYFNDSFPDYMATVGVQCEAKSIEINEKMIRLHIFILGMQESFKRQYRAYCYGSNGAIVMYDITNPRSLDKIPEWIQMIRENLGDIPILLVGNKVDLENREVSKEEAIKIKEKFNLSGYFEISARTGENIEETIRQMTRMILRNLKIID